ncbi:uncharacterized protein UV8b_07051 [Ustilaginoidea virens]|uniref:FAD-binding PCMH-type domain-containing protein n=1 Tax=Ustilaginoidea virens TaxID=1159556 RepID=A0A8E5HWB5_USTVR|nr:uncharacterized protein UV8b_07051 [Ustilaginoidea virens]QUC22810.1 hypothetical protein UV8b_07051 [Ustilaginoidea virens]
MDPDAAPDFQGNQFSPGTASYRRANDLYASSTYGAERDLNPGRILQPTGIEDIQSAVRHARRAGRPIAVRTGGHQYSGASSTGPHGIQLDLKPTFRRPRLDLRLLRDPGGSGKVYLRSSVSWTLAEVYDFLLDNGVFMPTGQCTTVCLGGHVQTGGHGMLARSFGLLGDYVRELDIVDHEGRVATVTRERDPDLFFGLLGGSPGSMGVVTHLTVEVQDDLKHQGSRGLWMAFRYRRDTLEALLDILVAKAEDPGFPRNYDLTVNVVSRQANLLDLFPGSEDELKARLPDSIHDGKDNIADLLKFKYALVVVYAQYVRLDGGGGGVPFSPGDLFDPIRRVPHDLAFGKESPDGAPMSRVAAMWLFRSPREFPYPYVKRTNTTRSTALSRAGWASWFAGRVDEVVARRGNGLWVSSQLQLTGGADSMFRRNAGNGTAYSWRDSTVAGTWDVFYRADAADAARAWQDENDRGALARFSSQDRRLLWGSYGDWDMSAVWPRYYDAATYEKLREVRKKADPEGVFTANPFCVPPA